MSIKDFLDSAAHDLVGHGFLVLSASSSVLYRCIDAPRPLEGLLAGLAGGGALMAGLHYKTINELNKRYRSLLERVKDNPEKLERLDSFFEDIKENKLHYGNKAHSHQKPSYKFTARLYRRQRKKVINAFKN